jgi:hypothetical protein
MEEPKASKREKKGSPTYKVEREPKIKSDKVISLQL